MKPKKEVNPVCIRMNKEQMAAAEYLARETKRTRSNAVNWAVGEKAVELGFKPPKKK